MTDNLSIMLVGPLPPPAGGMANQTRQLSELLEREGIRVELVQTNRSYSPAWIAGVRGMRALFRLVPYLRRLREAALSADVAHVMANSGWAWHLLAAPAIRIAVRRRVPTVVNYRGGLAPEFLAREAHRVVPLLRSADRLIVPSGFLQETFAGHGVDSEVIPNVVDTNVFSPLPHEGPRRAFPHIVVARNLESIYGVDLAIRAMALLEKHHPDVQVSVAGSGPERDSLARLAEEQGLADRIAFTGRLDRAAMAELYRSADVVLNPSRADNAPNSILEALACGIPVVSTRVGGVPYLVEHGETAWLVPPESPAEISDGIRRVLSDGALREHLKVQGLKLAASCSWRAVRALWLDLYAELATGRRASARNHVSAV